MPPAPQALCTSMGDAGTGSTAAGKALAPPLWTDNCITCRAMDADERGWCVVERGPLDVTEPLIIGCVSTAHACVRALLCVCA